MTSGLAARQAALVAALVRDDSPVPPGFDPRLIMAARAALIRKRAAAVARHWPLLAAGLGSEWLPVFTRWAGRRPTGGAVVDGWALARELARTGALPALAAGELASREAAWRHTEDGPPVRRRLPALSHVNGVIALQLAGRVRTLRCRSR